MTDISKPHDTLFKGTLQHKKIMQDWLQAHLPPEIIALADMSTLAPVPTEFIPKWPQTLHSDVVYSCLINGHPGYFHIIAEHVRREVVPLKSRKGKVDPDPYCCFPGAG